MKTNISFSVITILLLYISISLFLYNGIGLSDTNEYTPLLYRELDKNYLKNDWFVNINEGTFNVRSYFIRLIWLILFIIPSIPLVYFLLFLLTILLAGISTYLISFYLFKNKGIAIFNSFLILVGATFSLGGNLMVYGYLLSFGLSFSIALLGFYFLLKKRLFLYSLLLGLAVLVHFMWGHLIFAVLFFASLFASMKGNYQTKNHIGAFFIFLLFSAAILPIVFWQGQLGANLSGEKIAYILGHIRAPHHYMPFEWDITRYIEFMLFFLVFLVTFKKIKIESFNKNLIKIAMGAIFLIFFISIIFIEIFPISIIIKMHLFRLSTFLVFIEYLFIGAYIYQNLQQSKAKEKLKFLFYVLFSISLFSNHLILFSAPAFFIFNFLEKKINLKNSKIDLLALFFFLIALISSILFYKPLFILLQAKISRIVLFLFKIMLFIPLCAAVLFDRKITKPLRLTAALKPQFVSGFGDAQDANSTLKGGVFVKHLDIIKVMFVCSILISSIIFILAKPSFFYALNNEATEELYGFIKEYTDKDVIFLTPPSLPSFRLGAQRAIVVDFKSFPFGEKEMLEWLERISAVSNYPDFNNKNQQASELIDKGYKSLSEENITKLQKRYNFSYVVSEKPNYLNFKKKYENTNYILYEIHNQ